ncbi:phosphatidylinositol:ceramide inositolphosphotransferase 2-like isoform X3 [Lycium barbarum]|uniref:phosphatidylinositol:ceramide inositolphosphotransferase 2-like isoform X3 n=1 Tax=Lycium barbarum TaxID=112863 RepID=UPI00293F6FBC|nr:phosphatidylinositol:ceramide inositolphosphotransferase 2-like isoform X3 [Lycium barbarum]
MAFQQSLGTGSSNPAEAKAAMIGLKWCKEYGVPWLLQEVFNESRKVIDESNCIIQHCYREGNQMADALAKYIHGLAGRGVHYFYRSGPILQDINFYLLPWLGRDRTYISATVFTTIFLSLILPVNARTAKEAIIVTCKF